MKRNKGITLIALVITIIVLIILAGVSINLVLGQNGIFNRAKQGAKDYKIASIEEKVEQEILNLSADKLLEGERLTVEEALVGLEEKGIFEEIDLEEETGISEGYVIELGYDENENVIIRGVEKDTGRRIVAKVSPKGYTKGPVTVTITVKTNGEEVSSIEVLEGMVKQEDGTYQVSQNGTYLVKANLEEGEPIQKEVTITNIDTLAPASCTITVTTPGNGIKIEATAEDAEATTASAKSGIDYYEYYLNGVKQESNEITGLSYGTYTVSATAYDKAGNPKPSENKTVKISRKIAKVAAGYYYSLAIDEERNLWAWGENTKGQIGDSTTSQRNSPVQIKMGTKFKEISAGLRHSLAIDIEGNLWAWGDNEYGQLGDSSTTQRNSPVQIKPGTQFKKVVAGDRHTLAIDKDGNLWAWGYNGSKQVKSGAETKVTTPVLAISGMKFKEISAGINSSMALNEDGKLWTWGWSQNGQLGNGSGTSSYTTPTQVKEESTFTKIALGTDYCGYAIDNNNKLWGWGYNKSGQLGDGTTTQRNAPVLIEKDKNYKFISRCMGGNVNAGYSFAIDEEGNLWTCGRNDYGQLGYGATSSTETHYKSVMKGVRFKEVAVGSDHVLALDETGNLWTWGSGSEGQLGNGSAPNRITAPIQIF